MSVGMAAVVGSGTSAPKRVDQQQHRREMRDMYVEYIYAYPVVLELHCLIDCLMFGFV